MKKLSGSLLKVLFVFTSSLSIEAQTLINIDFGAGPISSKSGFAATGQSTNDFWNRYHHYAPKFTPGMPLVENGMMAALKFADGTPSSASIALTNAPGVWGNATGDPMVDSYIYAPNGSNILVRLTGLEAGRYHFFFYGHAAPDVSPEQNTAFTLRTGTNKFGPAAAAGFSNWQAGQPWRERGTHIVFRDVPVESGEPVLIEAGPGQNGIAVLNGMQILSRGTAPPRLVTTPLVIGEPAMTNLLFREIHYEGELAASGAAFTVKVQVESRTTNEISAQLFQGDIALLSPKLPEGWRIVNIGKQFVLHATQPGQHEIELQLAARSTRVEPWNQLEFIGPPAAIATLSVRASSADSEVQLLKGTPLPNESNKATARGVLGGERVVMVRWQSKSTEVQRDAMLVVETGIEVQATPAVVRYVSTFNYEILQARVSELRFSLPPGQVLTRLEAEQVRDWQVQTEDGAQVLKVEFIRPVEKSAKIILVTEQALASLPAEVELAAPAPLGVQRENGALRLKTEDLLARVESTSNLRQISAGDQETAAFRFNARPAAARVQLSRLQSEIEVTSRVTSSLEETRHLLSYELAFQVSRAGIYNLGLTPPEGYTVAELTGPGVEDWRTDSGGISVTFQQRVLGERKLRVVLERGLTNTPAQITITPLRVPGALKDSALIGAGASPGIQIKTENTAGVREVPIGALPNRQNELLAFRAERADWAITLAAERLAPRLVGEVFNLLTIGDGVVGGSATIRFGIANQGVQQFRIQVPPHWRNLEFTGLNLRRKDEQDNIWTISLQDKAWGAYTLVITYDFPFDPKGATFDATGAHPLNVERETGTIALTTASGLSVMPASSSEGLRQIDPSELAETDRALITRPVLLAYRYEGGSFGLRLDVTRHNEVPVLDAVADRAQLTSVLTPSGEMLTQASFMVKNNERQFQRFQLPQGATLWGVLVNGEPVKAERDGEWLLVSLPRREDRDQAFAVDIQYAQQMGTLGRLFPREARFTAPKTDVPGTYAQWEVFAPANKRLSGFDGNMTLAQGTTYGFRDAWQGFIRFYRGVWHDHGATVIVWGGVILFVIAVGLYGKRQGLRGVVGVLAVFCVLAILAGMLLPALSKAKSKAQRIKSVSNLKNIALAARIYATDNGNRFPNSFEEMMNELSTEQILFDPETGERYMYVGAGKSEANPNGILAYSSAKPHGREVALVDGSVRQVSEQEFQQMIARETQTLASRAGGTPMEFYMQNPELMPRYYPHLQTPAAPVPAGTASEPAPPSQVGSIGGVALTNSVTTTATVTGIRSLKIEIPRAGRAYHFTRVLNLNDEPPSIRVSIMSHKAALAMTMLFQLTAFVIGLGLVWFQWHRAEPKALWLAIGTGLVLLATAHLFITWRALHLVFIVGLPGILSALLAWIIWRALRRRSGGEAPEPIGSPLNPVPPATAALALLLGLGSVQPVEAAAKPPVSVVSAAFSGETRGLVARLDCQLQFTSTATNAVVMLFGEETAVQDFSSTEGSVRLWREGARLGVVIPKPGDAAARMTVLIKLQEDAGKRRLDFALPPALGTRLNLRLDEPDADVEFPSAVVFERKSAENSTLIEAVVGATDRLTLSWTPRLRRAGEIAATAFVEQASLLHVASGVASIQTVFHYQVTQGELRQLRIAIPESQRLLRVEGELVRSWQVTQDELLVELLNAASPETRLSLETEIPLEELPVTARVSVPVPLDVQRTAGVIGLAASEEVGVNPVQTSGLDRIENDEFARLFGDPKRALVVAWRFLRPNFNLALEVDLLQPSVEAVAHHSFTIGADQIITSSRIDYTVKRAGTFTLRLALPADGRVEDVRSDHLKSWNEVTDNSARTLEVNLKQRTLGAITLAVTFVRPLEALPEALELTAPRPLEVEKLSGFFAVASEPGIGVKTGAVTGLTEIPASSLPSFMGGSGLLGFKFAESSPQDVPSWSLSITTELLESWVRAEVVNFVSVSETLLTGRSLIRFDVQNAPTQEFLLRVPSDYRNVEIHGSGIRRRDETNGQWRVELQSKVRGPYQLTLLWEIPRPTTTNKLTFSGVEALNVERENGAVSFSVRGPLQITPDQVNGDLVRVDARELPAWAAEQAPSGQTPVLVYRYLRPGWHLTLDAVRFSDAAVLQALVDRALLRTVVADDGQLMTHMELTVRNNGRQHLEIALPAGAQVWSAFVAGEPVRPAQEKDRLLLPLQAVADSTVVIELTYVDRNSFPKTKGKVSLAAPRLGIPLKDARWELFLPPGYEYEDFGGSMTYEQADLAPIAQDFTLAEYARQEIAQEQNIQAREVDALQQAKSDLAVSNYSDARTKLNVFRSRAGRDEVVTRELKKLEDDLARVQSSNLIQAQEELARENSEQVPAKERVAAYDVEVAAQQVAQLQKAQEVAVARVSPLRVNLPTRGIRHSFAQVLQTDVNQPLTVTFSAKNQQEIGWFKKAMLWSGGFILLWILAGLAVILRPVRSSENASA